MSRHQRQRPPGELGQENSNDCEEWRYRPAPTRKYGFRQKGRVRVHCRYPLRNDSGNSFPRSEQRFYGRERGSRFPGLVTDRRTTGTDIIGGSAERD